MTVNGVLLHYLLLETLSFLPPNQQCQALKVTSTFGLGRRGDGGGGHCLVRMEWRPARWLVCLPLLTFPCTIKSRSSLLALAHPGGPGKRAVKRLWRW